MRVDTVGVGQGEKEVVIDLRSGSYSAYFGVHTVHGAEERQGLVDEMAAQVEQQTTGHAGVRALTPGTRIDLREPAFIAGFEPVHSAERSLLKERLNSAEISVPSAIVVDADQQVLLRGRVA